MLLVHEDISHTTPLTLWIEVEDFSFSNSKSWKFPLKSKKLDFSLNLGEKINWKVLSTYLKKTDSL